MSDLNSATVTVRVPGSTSNLGSGFDTLGLALRIYSWVRVARSEDTTIRLVSESGQANPSKAAALVREAALLFFRHLGDCPFGLEIALRGDVPVGRGLGASAIPCVGVLTALNKLTRAKLTTRDLLNLATRLEGHPDNASPALFGGFTVSGRVENDIRCVRFPVSSRLHFVTLIPRFEIHTEAARKLLPPSFARADAAHSLNRSALITAAFAKGDHSSLKGLFDDRFHQPYRETLLPRLSRVIRAGAQAGAIGGWLSGSGSAIICVTMERPGAVAKAMRRLIPDSLVLDLRADNTGATVV
jgi:homoserine kinase